MQGSYWFKRLVSDAKKMSSHIEFRRIGDGFYRIYWKGSGPSAYIAECYKEMPEVGYDIEEKDVYLESKKYYEEFEDNYQLTRKIKNFVEGYWEVLDRIKTNIYMIKNNKEHRKLAIQRYQTFYVK